MATISLPLIVIGSGPAGVAAADALLKSGRPVVMLDGGVDLEVDRKQLADHLAQREPDQWAPKEIQHLIQGNQFHSLSQKKEDIQLKRIFGSDFPYRFNETEFSFSGLGQLMPSLAQGGFSHVWGAAALKFTPEDIKDWPIQVKDLEPHYQEISKAMPIAGGSDDLSPLFGDGDEKLIRLDSQMTSIFHALNSDKSRGHGLGWKWGHSRLALKSSECRYCGLCLFGCPYRLIFSTEPWRKEMQAQRGLQYHSGWMVEEVRDSSEHVWVIGKDRQGNTFRLQGAAVFLAAGVLPTTRLLAQTKNLVNQRFDLKVSEYFLLPGLTQKSHAISQKRISLAQLFFELQDPNISNSLVHLQMYGYSQMYDQALKEKLGPLGPWLIKMTQPLLSRMMAIQGYLHSDDSSRIEVQLTSQGQLNLVGKRNPQARDRIDLVVKKLSDLLAVTDIHLLRSQMRHGAPGEGRHVGGSFPMQSEVSEFSSDRRGRVSGLNKVFAVDASVLPSIPATTITYTVMANARRIASEVLTEGGI